MHFELAVFGQRRNHMIRIHDFNVVRQFDIRREYWACALLAQDQGELIAAVQFKDHAFQVQQNINNVFTYARNR